MKAKRNLIPIWLLCAAMLPAMAQAQFTFTTNYGAITITGYTGLVPQQAWFDSADRTKKLEMAVNTG